MNRFSQRVVLVAVLPLLLWQAAFAADKKPAAFTDPAYAGPDFARQGEYVGRIEAGDLQAPVGAQVAARGEGKFAATIYLGGLPGAGWDGQTKYEGEGKVAGGAVVFEHLLGSAKLVDGVITMLDDSGNTVGTMKRTERVSPTLGEKPPAGAIVLFDGKNADAFENGRVELESLMPGVTSKRKFGDCSVHLEFRVPYMPEATGQARGNSGCYLQGRYEVQILDSFGETPANNGCGAIYTVRAAEPNMCYPPLAWQTYDIDFTAARYDASGQKTANARLTVRQNGELIQKDVEVPEPTRAAPVKAGPEPGPLYLQDHGNPVRYRNVWVVEK